MNGHLPISRRELLSGCLRTIGGLGLWSLAPLPGFAPSWLDEAQPEPIGIGRVTVPVIYAYREPSLTSERIAKYTRDTLLPLLGMLISPAGPTSNPTWYVLTDGYAHSGRIQRIPPRTPNTPLQSIPETGVLGEITVPLTHTYQHSRSGGWTPLYRLYYESLHWIRGIDQGPDGRAWYRLADTYPQAEYFVPAEDVRPVSPREFNPLAVDIPLEEKRLVISLERQSLTAFEGNRVVYKSQVSSGVHTENLPEEELPTDTPVGAFRIQLKMPSRHMGDGRLTADPEAYELPGVPWVMVFHETGVALHGTYWHNNFGTRMSHGCVNLRNLDARWLFRWTDPIYSPTDWYTRGTGTLVQVF